MDDVAANDAHERPVRSMDGSEPPADADRWFHAIATSGDGVWDWDVPADRIFLSAALRGMLGLPVDGSADSFAAWRERIHPDDLVETSAAAQRLFDGIDATFSREHRLCRDDGSVLWIHARGTVVSREPDGRPRRVVGVVTDISARKRSEEELARTRTELETVLARMTEFIVSLDADWRYTWCNDAAVVSLRKTRAELIGRSMWEVFPDIVGSEFERRYRAAMATQRPDEFEVEYAPYGVWVHVRVYPAPTGLTLFYSDVTERRRLMRERDRSQSFLQRLIDTVPIPICYKDAAGLIRGYNPAFVAFHGGPQERDVLRRAVPAWFPPDVAVQVERQDAELLAGGGMGEFQTTVPLACGGAREVLLIKAAYTNPDGSVAGLVVLIVDLSERLRAESELRDAVCLAESANVAKSQFLSTMSHEIRTPLNGVIGMTDLLLASGLNPEQTMMAETVQQCSHSLLAVIGDVLDLAKIEAGRMELEQCDIDLRRLTGDIQGMFTATALAKGLRLVVSVAPGVPARLRGDPGRLRQVLANLVGNAVKFTELGEVALEIALAEPAERAEGRVAVAWSVRDTGPGIAADYLPRLFEPFSQADGSHTRRHGGTGLGLAIARRLCDLMGGRLTVDSAPGRGSCFHFVLPMLPAVAGTGSLARRPTPMRWRRQPLVLIAEDEPICQLSMQMMLKEIGCRYALALDGDEAVAAVADGSFDLVLMDCQMPGCDGVSATRRIRGHAIDRHGRLPIIAVSANVFAEDRASCTAAGMDDFLPKPCTMEALRACLQRWAGHLLDAEG